MPRAKEATRLPSARLNHSSSWPGSFPRTIAWKETATSRASTSAGTPPSTAATVSLSALVNRSRLVVWDCPCLVVLPQFVWKGRGDAAWIGCFSSGMILS